MLLRPHSSNKQSEESFMEAIKGSIGELTALQLSILRSEQLRNYAAMLKGKIDSVLNVYLKEIYMAMEVPSRSISCEELNRFLLRIRQAPNGYQPKSYTSLKAKWEGVDTIVLTMSMHQVWRQIVGQREIPDTIWALELPITEAQMVDHRAIIREFKPLLDDTCGFIRLCWTKLIETGVDNVDTYYEICKIKSANIPV